MVRLSAKATMPGHEILEVAVGCANLVTALANSDTNEDGKASTQEIALAILSQVGGISTIVTKSKAAYLAFKMSTTEQRREVISAFAEAFDLSNDDAEIKIETVLTEANEIISSVIRLVNKFKKNQALPA